LAGLFDLAFAVFHMTFWRLFAWPVRLRLLDPVNRPLLPIMNIALILLLGTLGFALFSEPDAVLSTAFGRRILIGVSIFWLVRAVVQVSYYRLHHPASLFLFALFIVGAVLHGAAVAIAVLSPSIT
jgi:hypothetical protein